jgi:8-amino-7-oxononanoate synthase
MTQVENLKRSANAIQALLEERQRENRLRGLRSIVPIDAVSILLDGKTVVNFSSNDYLGLSKHEFLKERSIEFTSRWGVGSGASRLVSGNYSAYDEVEERLAKLKGTQSALIFSSGFQLNSSLMGALNKIAGALFCDRLCHNSLISGAQNSGIRFARFAHNDLDDLADKLKLTRAHGKLPYVVIESVYSMDGDIAPLAELGEMARRYHFELYIDEAHATGVFGESGMGLAKPESANELIMGTFSKGCGSFGAYIACSKEMREFLINFCPGLIYTTALPPAVIGSIDAALTLIPEMKIEREHLKTLSDCLRKEVQELGYSTGSSASQIVPIIVGADQDAVLLSKFLEERGLFAPAIRPPTVPTGGARIRVSLSAAHSFEHIETLLHALRDFRAKTI